jgi:hypothetical protein
MKQMPAVMIQRPLSKEILDEHLVQINFHRKDVERKGQGFLADKVRKRSTREAEN